MKRDHQIPFANRCHSISRTVIGTAVVSFLLVLASSAISDAATGKTTIRIGGGELKIEFPAKENPASKKAEVAWLTTAANTITAYFGYFPVKKVQISIAVRPNTESIYGRTDDGDRIAFFFGPSVDDRKLAHDWTATHEMFHLAFPDVDKQDWLGEGLSTYLEPMSRIRVGDLEAESMWANFHESFPLGLPQKEDRGLNLTHTWGRTYWGGCLFWFLADVQIREATHNAKSLDTGIKAVLKAGGDGSVTWSEERIFKTIDDATGLSVMKQLNEKMVLHPGTVDLPALWKRLGISFASSKIVYDEKAELAFVRKAMTARE